MKHKIIFSIVAVLTGLTAVQAQKGLSKIDIGYNVGLPMGSFKEQVDETSARGFRASVLYGATDRLSVGAGISFQDFYQKYPRQIYQLEDGSHISAVLTHSIQVMPIMAQVRYALSPGGTVQPYIGAGAGVNLITYTQLLGEFGGEQTKFGFAARPEAGVYIPFKKTGQSGLVIGATYNIMPFKEMGFENLNNLGFHAGVSLPLRK